MDDETGNSESNYPLAPSTARMSKTPSWVMLGFVLGAVFMFAFLRRGEAPPSTVSVRIVDAPKPSGPREPPPLTEIEAVFAVWGEHAVWSGDTTEVAYWNRQERKFTDFYEVRRIAGVCYFRSIPELTRRIVRHGRELPDSPLQFTETEEQYREWLDHGRRERPVERETAPPPPAVPAPPRVTQEQRLEVHVEPPKTAPPPFPSPVTVSPPKARK